MADGQIYGQDLEQSRMEQQQLLNIMKEFPLSGTSKEQRNVWMQSILMKLNEIANNPAVKVQNLLIEELRTIGFKVIALATLYERKLEEK